MPFEIRRLEARWAEALADFFAAIEPEEHFFHPHPLTPETAAQLAHYTGDDLYYVAVDGGIVLGYGLLRGWDEGFDVPSLGIAVRREARGTGLATCLMQFLHVAAQRKGATSVRLAVEPDNTGARRLYERLGYVFEETSDGRAVGRLALGSTS
jgi:ribosomal protein S18 acetylase RimI-like enzyme